MQEVRLLSRRAWLGGAGGPLQRGEGGCSDYVGPAGNVARQHPGGFGVAGELGSGFQGKFAARAIGDVGQVAEVRAVHGVTEGIVEILDRKSTRLNSSHLVISDAVF